MVRIFRLFFKETATHCNRKFDSKTIKHWEHITQDFCENSEMLFFCLIQALGLYPIAFVLGQASLIATEWTQVHILDSNLVKLDIPSRIK